MIQKIFPAFGTLNTISIADNSALTVADLVKRRMLQIHDRFSVFDPKSEIAQINQQAGLQPVAVSEETFYLLSLAQAYYKETKGTFDVTTGALSALWREAIRTTTLPSPEAVAQCQAHCGMEHLALNLERGTAFLQEEGLQLDLGGIVKGYAADEAKALLLAHDVQRAQINFGGTVVAIGAAQCVGIQHPFAKTGQPMASLSLHDQAIVTSGLYERCFFHEGKRYHHIIDPRTGMPAAAGVLSVSLIGEEAVMLDALATGVCCLGVQDSLPILRKRGLSAVFVDEQGHVQMTSDLQGELSFHG
ncbi:MAG: FAD:protein FMN transferase [Peptococcaceae bacterium]|nr:FAD:protein FMN transferase [Peptococcaceae bacterium]